MLTLRRAGQRLVCEVLAARHGSALDSLLTLYDADGRQVATNDDTAGSTDSRLEVTLPRDGAVANCRRTEPCSVSACTPRLRSLDALMLPCCDERTAAPRTPLTESSPPASDSSTQSRLASASARPTAA